MFTREHFEAVAKVIRETPNPKTRERLSTEFANIFEASNSLFNEKLFLAACESESEYFASKSEQRRVTAQRRKAASSGT